jgi:hypothetical protein
MRKYIAQSHVHDYSPYNATLYMARLKAIGAKRVRLARLNGWSNQPQVVTFEGDGISETIIKIMFKQFPEFRKWPPIIREKDWK